MQTPLRAFLTLASVSLLFFLVTALTFSSLGAVLPAMMNELHFSNSGAGWGYTLLGIFCGITATIPATLIRRIGVRATLLCGGVVTALAFAALAATHDLTLYLIGCSLSGLGFTLLATVPGTYLLTRTFRRPDIAFGLYFTIGGLGGVAGPQLYLFIQAFTGGWRDFWIVSAVLSLIAAGLSALMIDTKTDLTETGGETEEITSESWSAAAALKTPQFAVLAAAYSVFLIVDITVNNWSVVHLISHGVAASAAINMLSVVALSNAGARLAGGLVSRLVNVRLLLMLSLVILIAGLIALCAARDTSLMLVYAASIGIGSGLTFFSSTILLLDYYGRKPNLELFSIVNLISTVGSVGPVFAGFVADQSGSFVPAFLILGVLVLLVLIAVAWMKPPHQSARPRVLENEAVAS
jgi:OFA family oxalate/formate antiporter-like MFS transporter